MAAAGNKHRRCWHSRCTRHCCRNRLYKVQKHCVFKVFSSWGSDRSGSSSKCRFSCSRCQAYLELLIPVQLHQVATQGPQDNWAELQITLEDLYGILGKSFDSMLGKATSYHWFAMALPNAKHLSKRQCLRTRALPLDVTDPAWHVPAIASVTHASLTTVPCYTFAAQLLVRPCRTPTPCP